MFFFSKKDLIELSDVYTFFDRKILSIKKYRVYFTDFKYKDYYWYFVSSVEDEDTYLCKYKDIKYLIDNDIIIGEYNELLNKIKVINTF